MGFREDVSIRVTPDGEDSRVDIRSASRYFESDLGSNAARVRKLIDDINTAVDNASLKPVKKPALPAEGSAEGREEVTSSSFRGDAQHRAREFARANAAIRGSRKSTSAMPTSMNLPNSHTRVRVARPGMTVRGYAANRYVPPITGSPSVATIPRATRSSRCASTE